MAAFSFVFAIITSYFMKGWCITMKHKTKRTIKLALDVLNMTIRIKMLDIACFIEETRCKGEYSDKLIVMNAQKYVLYNQIVKRCDEGLAVIHDQ